MKKNLYLFVIVLISMVCYETQAQEQKCYCNLVENYTKDAKKVYEGEILMTVPVGQELWIDMRPIAHQRNQGENGGCRLVAGQKYVANKYTSEPLRAYDCGNPIRNSTMYAISNITVTQPCNCPNDTFVTPTTNQDVVFIDGGVNQQPGLLTNSYPNLTQTWSLEDLNKTLQVDTRTWGQKNGWWFYPLTILTATTLVEGLSDGEWFDWHNKPFAKEGGGGVGNSGGGVDHNPNAIVLLRF